jgi:hypothetical protein
MPLAALHRLAVLPVLSAAAPLQGAYRLASRYYCAGRRPCRLKSQLALARDRFADAPLILLDALNLITHLISSQRGITPGAFC